MERAPERAGPAIDGLTRPGAERTDEARVRVAAADLSSTRVRVRRVLLALAAGDWVPERTRARLYRRVGIGVGSGSVVLGRHEFGSSFFMGRLDIGDDCIVNKSCWFDPGDSEIRIGDDVYIGARVALQCATHEMGDARRRAGRFVCRPITIGSGSWLGIGVTVLPGVHVAPGCVVAAGSVVTRDTAPDGLYAGSPARRVRDLD